MDMLTQKQQEILEFVSRSTEGLGYPPSVREIAQHFDVNVNAIQRHLEALMKKGYLTREEGKGRALKVVKSINVIKDGMNLVSENLKNYLQSSRQNSFGTFRLPLVARIAAGQAISVEDDFDNFLEISEGWFERSTKREVTNESKNKMVAVKVVGSSMAGDAILDGDIAIISLQKTAHPSDIVAVRIGVKSGGSEVTLKRLKRKGELIELCPSNKEYEVRSVPADDVEIVGKYVGILRRV